jgi:hypothetical protein
MFSVTRGWVTAVTALVVTAGFFLGCSAPNQSAPPPKVQVDPGTLPEWVQAKIEELSSQPVTYPPASIARYWYRNQTVYFMPPGYHALSGTLFDAEGVLMCHPGVGRNDDGRCPDFFETRSEEEIVWRDSREIPKGSNAPDLIFFALAALQVIHITLMN